MPGCHTPDALAAIWTALENGDEDGGRELFYRILPLMNYERLYGIAVYKWILYRRGLIATTTCRAPAATLDADDLRELEIIMTDVEPMFSV